MTLRDVARYLHLNERAVGRMAEAGELPAQRATRGWRFSRTAIEAWRTQPGRATQEPLPAEPVPPLTLAGAMDAGRMSLQLHGTNRDAVLHELVALVLDPGNDRHAELFFQALKAREDLCSTCVNDGVAIPHARNALIGLVDQAVVAYGRQPNGVDFGAIDGQPVKHFFLLCAPNVRDHLKLLARLSRLLHKPDFRAKLDASASPDELIRVVGETEQSIPVS